MTKRGIYIVPADLQDELTESKGVLIATTGTNNLYEVDTSALFRALLLAGDSAEGGENQFVR